MLHCIISVRNAKRPNVEAGWLECWVLRDAVHILVKQLLEFFLTAGDFRNLFAAQALLHGLHGDAVFAFTPVK